MSGVLRLPARDQAPALGACPLCGRTCEVTDFGFEVGPLTGSRRTDHIDRLDCRSCAWSIRVVLELGDDEPPADLDLLYLGACLEALLQSQDWLRGASRSPEVYDQLWALGLPRREVRVLPAQALVRLMSHGP